MVVSGCATSVFDMHGSTLIFLIVNISMYQKEVSILIWFV